MDDIVKDWDALERQREMEDAEEFRRWKEKRIGEHRREMERIEEMHVAKIEQIKAARVIANNVVFDEITSDCVEKEGIVAEEAADQLEVFNKCAKKIKDKILVLRSEASRQSLKKLRQFLSDEKDKELQITNIWDRIIEDHMDLFSQLCDVRRLPEEEEFQSIQSEIGDIRSRIATLQKEIQYHNGIIEGKAHFERDIRRNPDTKHGNRGAVDSEINPLLDRSVLASCYHLGVLMTAEEKGTVDGKDGIAQ